MPYRKLLSALTALLLCIPACAANAAQTASVPAPAARSLSIDTARDVAAFVKSAENYVALRKSIAGTLEIKLTETSDQAQIAARERALGQSVRAARATAKRGDLFNSRTTKLIRSLITADFRQRTGQRRRLELDEVPVFRPQVNQTYPSDGALATFPATLLAMMPKLPEGLEYRLVGNDLILRDVEANVIVDYIPNVIS